MKVRKAASHTLQLEKCPTGITGLDEITNGGLPRGRPTLVAGGAGSGKTLLALEFLVKGATLYDEPGVFMAFEETAPELATNVDSLGFDLTHLAKRKKLAVDYVYIERSEIEETGEYDLEGLFIRLGHAIDTIKAKRVVLDTLEVLFAGLPNESILRAELRRLFRFLKEKRVTAIVTAERGTERFTRHGLEEYVADCVILLDHRVTEQISTRRLRVAKYRGSAHGTNEYPFLIDQEGISILPVTSLGLDHGVSSKRISTGIDRLDAMFGGKGYFRGSSILVSGTAGTGKSTMAAHFAEAACKRGERCMYLAFEESPQQLVRNMSSVGIGLKPFIDRKLLLIRSERPTFTGLEMHLVDIMKLVNTFDPQVLVMDPVTNLIAVGLAPDVKAVLTRLIDFLKTRQVTTLLTSLTTGGSSTEQTDVGVSSLMDTWVVLKDIEGDGERNRGISIVKSRGMAHSNQFREFRLTDKGFALEDVSLDTKEGK
ncbi:MAG: circadian clock protein KaiC [Syntrophorhabdaceae bacterium]|nr:circadian clock protein KaiC [Syntrophorhabdaceae bacterium]